MARCARDVLSRDAPRETGCSRSAEFSVLKRLSGIQLNNAAELNYVKQLARRLVICFANTQCAALTERVSKINDEVGADYYLNHSNTSAE
jgi:hypothetical protein